MARITAVAARYESATVEAAAAAGALSVTVDTTVLLDLDAESGETCRAVIAGSTETFTIVATEDDEDTGIGTLTIAAPGLPAAVEVGDEIRLWDALAGGETVTYKAPVSDEYGPFEAEFSSAPTVTPESLVGAEVDVDDDGFVERVYGREAVIDGRQIAPDTLPDPAIPTEPPASSPAVTVLGTAEGLLLRTEPVEASTMIAYHVSTTEGFTPDATTLHTSTRSNIINVTTLPDGSPLAEATTYYVRTVASNVAGEAAPSAEASATLDPARVAQIAAAEAALGFILTGRIEVGAAHWDADEGLVIPQPDGGVIRLPVDGMTAAQITAHLTARSLDVEDNANFYGLTQLLGNLQLVNGITDPRVPVSTSRTWDSLPNDYADPDGKHGLCDSSGGTNWITVFPFGGLFFLAINKTTGAYLASAATGSNLTGYAPDGGVTRIGSSYYTLGMDINRGIDWYVYRFDSTFTKTGEWKVADYGDWSASPAIGTNGTNVLVARSWNGGGNGYTAYTYSTTGTLLSTASYQHDLGRVMDLGYVGSGLFDFAADRIFFAPRRPSDTGGKFLAFNAATTARIAAQDFPTAAGSRVQGATWDGTRFHHLDVAGTVWSYAAGANVDGNVDVAYTWFDDADPDHETTIGTSLTTFTRPARTYLTVETPAAPQVDAVGTDVANQIRVYAAPSGSPVRLQATLPVGVRSARLDVLDTGSAVAPLVNGFDGLGITPGRWESGARNASNVPHLKAEGDGAFRAVKAMQAGNWSTGTFAGTGAANGKTLVVTFDPPFDAPPAVTLGVSVDPLSAVVRYGSLSATGVSIVAYRATGTATFDVSWQAMAVTQ